MKCVLSSSIKRRDQSWPNDHIFVILFLFLLFVQPRVRFQKKRSFPFLRNLELRLTVSFFFETVKQNEADDTNILISLAF
jgi:hypothetical protein